MVLKSPKWLRWLINFEIAFGKDLDPLVKAKKLYPYLKHIESEKNEKEIPKQNFNNRSTEELAKDIENIVSRISKEFANYPFKDKYNSYNTNYEGKNAVKVEYTFENGDKAIFIIVTEIEEYLFEYTFKTKSSVNSITTRFAGKRLYDLVKSILVQVTNFSVHRNETKTTKTKAKTSTTPPGKKVNESVKEKYNTIVKQIKIRQEELNRTNKKASTYVTLENELNNYKKMADKLKAKLYV